MSAMSNWAEFVSALRETLISEAPAQSNQDTKSNPSQVEDRRALIKANLKRQASVKFNPDMSDDEFWKIAALKPFYAGKVAWTVDVRADHMWSEYFQDRQSLSDPRWNEGGELFNKFVKDPKCFRNRPSLKKTISAARRINEFKKVNKRTIIEFYTYGANDVNDPNSLLRIYTKLKNEFTYGPVSVYHLMMELGFQFVKPDRVLNLITARIGLIDSYNSGHSTYRIPNNISTDEAVSLSGKQDFIERVQVKYREISDVSGVPMRLIDYMIVKLGQKKDFNSGFARTICSPERPLCNICQLKPFCSYGKQFG